MSRGPAWGVGHYSRQESRAGHLTGTPGRGSSPPRCLFPPQHQHTITSQKENTRCISALCRRTEKRQPRQSRQASKSQLISTGTSLLKDEKEGKQVHPEVLVNGASQQFWDTTSFSHGGREVDKKPSSEQSTSTSAIKNRHTAFFHKCERKSTYIIFISIFFLRQPGQPEISKDDPETWCSLFNLEARELQPQRPVGPKIRII